MRRALGAVVVAVSIGMWRATDALLLRPIASSYERVLPHETSPTVRQPAKIDSSPDPGPRFSQNGLAGSSFRRDPFAFLSHAPADSLDLLPGVGPVIAARIIDTRHTRGAFTSWTEVLAVKGIGPATVARWRALAGQ